MKTPDEIKMGLECCNITNGCKHCPYDVDDAGWSCAVKRNADALTYIQQLERERDAAVDAAHGVCKACIHYNRHYPPGDIMSCCKFEECLYGMDEWDAEDHWQWRGVQEVE